MIWRFVTIRRPFALILGDTAEKEALLAVEKLRKVIAEVRLPSKDESAKGHSLEFSAGLAEAVVRESYDPVDIVTEVINRASMRWRLRWCRGRGRLWRWERAGRGGGCLASCEYRVPSPEVSDSFCGKVSSPSCSGARKIEYSLRSRLCSLHQS